jgi:hypothetical protein
MKLFLRPLLWTMTALLAVAPVGSRSSTEAAEPGAATCDRFTLEKVRLGMTRSEVEALALGKVEVLGETTDTLRLRVRGAKQKQKETHLLLANDRVQIVEVVLYANKAGATAALADLRGRWGEPDKEEPDPEKEKRDGRVGFYELLKWSDRNCQAYGAYYYNSFWMYRVLSSSPNTIRKYNPEANGPAIVR